jgi:hypothetical protein
MDGERLHLGLEMLGELLSEAGLAYDLVVIGGGALLLHRLISRPTEDLDAVAMVRGERMVRAQPLPGPLRDAIRVVGETLDLANASRDGKDWLNGAPTVLLRLGLPEGFLERAEVRPFRALTIRLPARQDLITLKLLAATDLRRGGRTRVDLADLRAITPTRAELRQAVAWCVARDGRPDVFEFDMLPALEALGLERAEVADWGQS